MPPSVKEKLQSILALAAIFICFLILASKSIHAHFQPDDMMNMHFYWSRGLWVSFLDCLHFWSTAYRPFGAFYYLPIYRIFGLDPLPYRIVTLAIILANCFLAYALAWRLTKSQLVAFFTAIIMCAHAELFGMYFADSTIYDALALFFCLSLLLVYAGIRDHGNVPGAGQTILLLVLFIAALDSKEIAVVAAGFVLAYEIFYHGFPRNRKWTAGPGRLPVLLLAAAVVYAVGKTTGTQAISNQQGYLSEYSWDRYVSNNSAYIDAFFYLPSSMQLAKLVLIYAIFIILLIKSKTPSIRWSCFYVLTAALPISFVTARTGSSLAIPFFGWALLVCSIFATMANLAPRRELARIVLFGALTWYFAHQTISSLRGVPMALNIGQRTTWKVITQLRDLPFRPKPGSFVLITGDPFPGYDTYFIAELLWNDPSVHIVLAQHPDGGVDVSKADHVIAFDISVNSRLVR